MNKALSLILIYISVFSFSGFSQNNQWGEIHGNFQMDAQYYNADSAIGAPPVPEKMLMNSFANFIYTKGNFTAGIRYETYLNALQGFDPRYKNSGIPYRYASYKVDNLEITVGNYYEQFGNGLIFRSYEERGLGYDNAMDGIRLRYEPFHGINLKGFIGKQRFFFDQGPGIVRGIDGEVEINELFAGLKDAKTKVTFGGSFVSKYQSDQDPVYKLPENVAASAGRINLTRGGFNLGGEYAYKINDPSSSNGFIYKPGEALYLTTGYSQKGFGISFSAKRIDNMSFRSDRAAAIGNFLYINYLPALSKQHTYSLAAFYPYATQPNGEMGFQGELVYKIKKETKLGGPFGTDILINYSAINGLDTVNLNDLQTERKGYKSDFFALGKEAYFKDLVIEVTRKFSKKVKTTLLYANQVYNMGVIQKPGSPIVYSNIAVADVTCKFASSSAIRLELEHLSTRQDQKSWAAALLEYTISSSWFIAGQDQYNYGNDDVSRRFHYFNGTVGFIKNATRISLSYGKQRAGIFCVGGVCRTVPASNGVTLSISSSF